MTAAGRRRPNGQPPACGRGPSVPAVTARPPEGRSGDEPPAKGGAPRIRLPDFSDRGNTPYDPEKLITKLEKRRRKICRR